MEVIPGLPGGIIDLSRKSGRLQDWLGRMSDSWQLVEVIPPILWWGWGCIPRTYSDGFCFKKNGRCSGRTPFWAWNQSVRSKNYPPENSYGTTKMEKNVSDDFPDFKGAMFRFQILVFLRLLKCPSVFLEGFQGVTLQPKVWNDHFWWGYKSWGFPRLLQLRLLWCNEATYGPRRFFILKIDICYTLRLVMF